MLTAKESAAFATSLNGADTTTATESVAAAVSARLAVATTVNESAVVAVSDAGRAGVTTRSSELAAVSVKVIRPVAVSPMPCGDAMRGRTNMPGICCGHWDGSGAPDPVLTDNESDAAPVSATANAAATVTEPSPAAVSVN